MVGYHTHSSDVRGPEKVHSLYHHLAAVRIKIKNKWRGSGFAGTIMYPRDKTLFAFAISYVMICGCVDAYYQVPLLFLERETTHTHIHTH